MTEDVEQYNRKAKRIRDNIIDALGPYHVTSDIIVNTQHGPVNSGLFGIMQSPINSLSSVRFPNSSNDSIGDERLSTARCLETMKDVAPPLSVIETTLPFSKKPLIGQIGLICDGKMSMPSTSGNYDRTSDLKQSNNMRRKSEEEDTRKRRKRKKSNDFTNGDQFERSERYNGVRDMGRPCSSLNNAKDTNGNEGSMTMNDLFGDDKKYMRSEEKDSKTLRNGKKKRNDGSRKADKWEKQQKEDGESPDSGIVDSGSVESDREPREQQRDHPCTSSIIDVMARLDPMLSPVRQPSLPPVVRNDGITSLKCVLDLSTLSSNERSRLFKNVHSVKAMMEKTGLPPKPALSPTPRPSLCHSPSPFSTKSLSPAQLSQETRKSCTSLPSVSRDAKKTDWKADNELSKSSSFTRQRVNSDVVATSKQKRDDFDAESSSSSASHKNGLIKVHTTSTSVDEMKNERRAVKKNNSSEPSRLYKKSSNASSSTVLVQKNEDREKIERPGSSFSESSASTKKREGQREKERTKDVEKGKLGSKEKEKVKVEVESGSNGAVKPEKDICGEKSCDELTIKKERRNTSSEKPLPLKKPHRTSMSCHAGMLAPKCKFKLELNDDGSFKSANYYQNDVARPLKHKADHETSDKMRKIMLYFDSVVYFILSAATLSSSQNRQCTMVKETAELLKNTTNRFAVINNSFTPRMIHFVSRLKVLSARVQSVLNYHVYKSQEPQAYKYSAALSKFDSQCHELEAAALRNEALANVTGSQSARSAATPSPASSTHSAANERFKEITLPLAVYQLQKGLVKIFQSKLNSQQLWDKTNSVMEPIDREMILTLDRICGELTMESGLVQLSEYLATGVAWLRDEYEDEKASEQQFT